MVLFQSQSTACPAKKEKENKRKYNSIVWDKAELTGDSCQRCWNTNGFGITRDTLLLSSENTEIWEQMKALGANFPLCVFTLTKDIVVPLDGFS